VWNPLEKKNLIDLEDIPEMFLQSTNKCFLNYMYLDILHVATGIS
jgi:hypothetical protein